MGRVIFNIAAKCDKAGRSQNQDNYWVCPDLSHCDKSYREIVGNDEDIELLEKGALLVVADGMGGMNAGEKASELVIAGIKKRFANIPNSVLSNEEDIKKYIKESIIEADQSVKVYAKENRSAEGLGSTIVLLWILNEKAYCAWCGDSRIYRYNPNNQLVRLSHDHSYVQGLVDDGKIEEEEAFDHPDGNIITRSLGDNGEVANPEIMVYDLFERDVFLLCSDGLCGLLPDKEIESLISTNCSSSKDALNALWNAGTKAGWTDNATIDLLCVLSGGKRPKGVAVGYPTKVKDKVQKNNQTKKDSQSQHENFFAKLIRPPFLYMILAATIALFSLALYQRCSSTNNDESGNHIYNINTGNTNNSSTGTNTVNENNASHENPANGNGSNNNVNHNNSGRQNNTNNSNNNSNNSNNNSNNNSGSNNGGNNENNNPANDNNNGNHNPNNGNNNIGNIINNINNHQNNTQEDVINQPDPQYIEQLNAVRGDVNNVREALNRARQQSGTVTKQQYNTLNNFCTNVNHLADKSNPSYKCLDSNIKYEIASWERLVNEINAIEFRVIEDFNEGYFDGNPSGEYNSQHDGRNNGRRDGRHNGRRNNRYGNVLL